MSTAINIANQPQPSNGHVREVIDAAERELHELLRQRAEIMRRMGTIKQTLVYLARTFGDDVLNSDVLALLGRGAPRKQPGFTRACRTVLMEAGMPLEARQGYRELARRFPDLVERHKDPMASVTTVFNRLVTYAEVRSFLNAKGRRVWEWIAESEKAGAGTEHPALGLPVRPV
jgi:hypothetical protein